MFRLIRNFRSGITLALVILAFAVSPALADAAGLVGYRNDTNQAVVVQSTVTSNGMTRRSKPQTLYPGEVALDGLAFTGTRRITVYDAKKPSAVLFQDDVSNTDDVFYSIRPKAVTVAIKGQPPPPPQVELVKTQPPAMPKPGKPTSPPPPKK